MKYPFVPVRLVVLVSAVLVSGTVLLGQSSPKDSGASLKGKKTIFAGRTPEERDYYSRLFGDQSGLVLVSDLNKADLVLDVAYESDYGVDKPRGTRGQKAVGDGQPDYDKPDSDRQRYVSSSKITVRVFARSGSSWDTLVWKKSKTRRSSSGGMAPNMPASWERLTADTIPPHNLPPKDVVPELIKAFLKDFAKAQ